MAQKLESLAAAGIANNIYDEPYVRYDDPGVEPQIDNEVSLQNELFDIIRRTHKHNFTMHRHAMRATHVKTQAIGNASAENAAKPHPIAIRFATEPSFLQDDRNPGPRGCGMKVSGVEGTFMDPKGEQTHTQDLTFNNAPLLELWNLPTTVDCGGSCIRGVKGLEGR